MPKDTELNGLDDFGDFDKEFGDFGFDDDTEPPKNAREAVTRTVKDFKRGFVQSVTDDKLKTAGILAKNALPTSLSNEASVAAETARKIKNELEEGMKEFKKGGKDTIKSLEELLPDGKIKSKLKSIREKFGLTDDEPNTASARVAQDNQIANDITTALGIMQERQQASDMIRQTIESKRSATTNHLLQSIYAETKFQRIFHAETTNKFYRKSLELQYKSLYLQKEQLELVRTAFSGFQKQFEALVLNTGLPDIIKANNKELLKGDFKAKLRRETIDKLYKEFNISDNITKNILGQVKNFREGITRGLDTTNQLMGGLGQLKDISGGMGITPGQQAGEFLGEYLTGFVGRKLGAKISSTRLGKKSIYGIKNAFADPNAALKQLSKEAANKKGLRWASSFLDYAGNMMGSASKTRSEYIRRDLDSQVSFDARAHDSIVKVIPGLLSKMLGELQVIRKGTSPNIKAPSSANEVIYDFHNDKFTTKKDVSKNVSNTIKKAIDKTVKPYIDYLLMIYKDAGANISGQAANDFGIALIKEMVQGRAGLSMDYLTSEKFLNTLPSDSSKNIRAANVKLIKYVQKDPYYQDSINNYLSLIKQNLPSLNSYFESLYKSGHGNILVDLGVANSDDLGRLSHSDKGIEDLILKNVKFTPTATPAPTKSTNINNNPFVKAHSTVASGMTKAKNVKISDVSVMAASGLVKVNNKITEMKDTLKKVDKDTLVSYTMSKKGQLEEVINDNIPEEVKRRARAVHNRIKNDYQKASNQVKVFLEENPNAQYVKEKYEELQDISREYIHDLQNGKINKEKIRVYKDAISDKTALITGFIRGKEDGLIRQVEGDTKKDSFTKRSFEKMREWDRKIVANLPSAPRNILKSGKDVYQGIKAGIGFISDINGKTAGKVVNLGYMGKDAVMKTYEEAKAEYYASEEYRSGLAPTFNGWLNTMKYQIKDKKDKMTVKNVFKQLRKVDRWLAGKIMKGFFKAPGVVVKGGLKGLGMAGKALGATTNVFLDMLPMGMGNVIKAPFALMNKTLELAGLKEKQDKKQRAGSWISRLNFFNNRKKDNKGKDIDKDNKGFMNKIMNFAKDNPMTTGIMILGGINSLLGKMGISLTDIVDAVKTVGNYIYKGFQGFQSAMRWVGEKIGGFIDFLPDWMKPDFLKSNSVDGDPNNPNGPGSEIGGNIGSAVAGVTGAYAAGSALKHIPGFKTAGKVMQAPGNLVKNTIKGGFSLGKTIVGLVRDLLFPKKTSGGGISGWFTDKAKAFGSFIAEKTIPKSFIDKFSGKNAEKTANLIDKKIPSPNKVKDTVGKVLKKAGPKATGKIAARATALASGLTGVGLVASAGMLIWDVGWVLYYWLFDGYSFLGAISMQLLGEDYSKGIPDDEEESVDSITSQPAPIHVSGGGGGSVSAALPSSTSDVGKLANSVSSSPTSASSSHVGVSGVNVPPGSKVKPEQLAKLKVEHPEVNDSPFIKPMPQSSLKGQPALVKQVHPELYKRFKAFAQDYYMHTGKKIKVNSGLRTEEQQKYLWERESGGVKATLNKWADYKNVEATKNGKYYGFRGGRVGHPTDKSMHTRGLAIDVQTAGEMPGVDKTKYTPWLDDMLAKHGLARTLTDWYKLKTKGNTRGTSEAWHIQMAGTPTIDNEIPPETSKISNTDMKAIAPDEATAGIQAEESLKTNNTSVSSTGSVRGVSTGYFPGSTRMPSVSGDGSASAAVYNSFSSTPSSNSNITTVNGTNLPMSDGNIENLLRQQLEVQTSSRDLLREIRDRLVNSNSAPKNPATTKQEEERQRTNTTLPPPAVDLKRKYATA